MDLESRINEDDKSAEQEQEEGKGTKEQHFHVLAVDDSLIDRKLLERLLTLSSYRVTCVDSGNKALEYLGLLDNSKDKIDSANFTTSSSSSSCSSSSNQSAQQEVQGYSKVNLIITDYSMPGMNGYDLLKRVKGSCRKDIPVVVMSSENVPSRINMCLEGGAEEFLLKPVRLSDLSKLQSHLWKPLVHSRQGLKIGNNSNDNENNNGDSNERNAMIRECSERRSKTKELAVATLISSTVVFSFICCFVAIFMREDGLPFFMLN